MASKRCCSYRERCRKCRVCFARLAAHREMSRSTFTLVRACVCVYVCVCMCVYVRVLIICPCRVLSHASRPSLPSLSLPLCLSLSVSPHHLPPLSPSPSLLSLSLPSLSLPLCLSLYPLSSRSPRSPLALLSVLAGVIQGTMGGHSLRNYATKRSFTVDGRRTTLLCLAA